MAVLQASRGVTREAGVTAIKLLPQIVPARLVVFTTSPGR